jgi:hypothetical protein
MYNSRRVQKPTITILDRKDITDYVRKFHWHMREKYGRVFNLKRDEEVRFMVEQMNRPEFTTFKSLRDPFGGYYYWDEQVVEFKPSNLGKDKGFIFYFRCKGCYHRVKYLYEYSMIKPPLCRICCHLPYQQPSRNARALSRALRQPYLSSEAKYGLIKRAGITVEDVKATI